MRGGLAIAILAAVLAALIFTQASQQLARDIQSRPHDLEAAAPKASIRQSIASSGNFVRLHRQISSRLLSSGSEGSL